MTITLAKWTLDEYHALIDSEVLSHRRIELLSGEIVEMPPEGPEHAYLAEEAATYLRRRLGERARVREARPITIPETGSEPEPDLAVVHPLGEVYYSRHPYPTEIFFVVEFSKSSLSKDLERKRKEYATAGIPEYWVANLKQRELIVHRDPVDRDYCSIQMLTQGTLSPLAFADVSMNVRSLFIR